MAEKYLIDAGSSGQGWSCYSSFILCMQRGIWRNPWAAVSGLAKGPPPDEVSPEVSDTDTSLSDIDISKDTDARNDADIAMPLKRGSILHTGIAHLNALRMQEAGISNNDLPAGMEYCEPHDAMSVLCRRFEITGDECKDLHNVYDAYCDHYKYDPWEPLFVERFVEFRVAGYRYTMRIDLGVRDTITGKVFMVDTKTSFRISQETSEKYTLSGQFVALDLIGLKLYGADFGGVYTNLLPSSLEGAMAKSSAEARFRRIRRPPTPAITADVFRTTIGDVGDRVQRLVDEGRSVDAYPKALQENICITNYGKCEFYDRCQWGWSSDE